MSSTIRVALLLVLAGGLMGCQTMDSMVKVFQDMTGISTKVVMINPPNSPATAQMRKVAVVGDSSGADMRNKVEALLTNVSVDGEGYFTVIERQDSELIQGGQIKGRENNEIDKKAIAEYGKGLGSDGVYVITNVRNYESSDSFLEERRRCKNPKEKKCDDWVKYKVKCTEKDVQFSFTPKLVNVSDMTIVYGRNITTTKSDKVCENSYRTLASTQSLINAAAKNALEVFRKDVSPYSTTEKVLIKTSDVESKEAELLLERGEEFAEKGRWKKACELWQQVSAMESASPAPWYNLGVCHERVGEYQDAVALYNKAESLSMEVDQRISDRLLATQEKLQRSQQIENIASAKDSQR